MVACCFTPYNCKAEPGEPEGEELKTFTELHLLVLRFWEPSPIE